MCLIHDLPVEISLLIGGKLAHHADQPLEGQANHITYLRNLFTEFTCKSKSKLSRINGFYNIISNIRMVLSL
jgi:hypothetical protein